MESSAGSGGPPGREEVRKRLEEKGVSAKLVGDAMFLLDAIGDLGQEKKGVPSRPTRILSSEEVQGIRSDVIGKLFRLYYLGYMRKEDMEAVMTSLLFVPHDIQDDRARQSVAGLLGISSDQANYIFDGGADSSVVH